ncbi:cell wall metabolism sensor histidine kinase WalK [Fusibacter sp. 3D3]|uniref:sensor histidine kinase n=1 Tax=Fusibacter sp. 3D3 TaxID=1048380 RepID=UPI000853A80B|nr:HAMP domain-containing sensor histidine kinase [Fusibacter sp. 3D3]GAU75524.1 phosphate regulon sensor protein PhoR [Fusibacter sp. 3D3]
MNKTKKLWTIERKIMMPYIGFMIALPLVILIVFNIAMRLYTEKNARDEIRNTLVATNLMLKQQLIKRPLDFSDETDRKRFSDQIDFVNEIFKVSRMANNTDIFIFSKTGELIFPSNRAETDPVILAAKEAVLMQEIDGIQRVTVNQMTYLIAGAKIEINQPTSESTPDNAPKNTSGNLSAIRPTSKTFHAVYVSSLNAANLLLRRINLILLSIVGVTLLISSILFKKIAASISKPIMEASSYADAISSGKYDKLSVHQDTAEIYQLMHSLNQMSLKLEVQDQTQRNFLQNVSHELRTPLMSIQGYAEGLVGGVFKEVTHPAQIIADESIRLKGLVDELITLSRLESTSVSVQKSDVELKQFLLDVVERAAGAALKAHKQVKLVCEDSLKLYLDEALLEKTISNLLSNAIRHAQYWIEIKVEKMTEVVKISISDDGKGFKASEIEFLFDRFFKGSEGNHGLGLAIVKSAVHLNEGTIKAYNGVKGAVFEIEFRV